MTAYQIVIPTRTTNIARGSGIVMLNWPVDGFGEHTVHAAMVYYEGNLYGATNLNTFEERVQRAAGRAHCRYPTTARQLVDPEEFVVVGRCYPEENYSIEIYSDKKEWVREWCNE